MTWARFIFRRARSLLPSSRLCRRDLSPAKRLNKSVPTEIPPAEKQRQESIIDAFTESSFAGTNIINARRAFEGHKQQGHAVFKNNEFAAASYFMIKLRRRNIFQTVNLH